MFEPGETDIGVVLCDMNFGATRLVISPERDLDGGFAMQNQGIRERDCAFHGELGAGSYGEVRRCLGVAQKHNILMPPRLAEYPRKVSPHGTVDDERMAFQFVLEYPLEQPRAFLFPQSVEPERRPGVR